MNASFSIAASAVLMPGEAPDISFVEPMVRRRLSPLQRIYFHLADKIGGCPLSAVFASRDGEDTLTRRIVDDFKADGSVSPHRFSTSVYNAAPGLWSVRTRNRAPYTAVASGEDSIEAGILEAVRGKRPALLVYAEETDGGYGAAALLADGPDITVRENASHSAEHLTFKSLAAFLRNESDILPGRWIRLERMQDRDDF